MPAFPGKGLPDLACRFAGGASTTSARRLRRTATLGILLVMRIRCADPRPERNLKASQSTDPRALAQAIDDGDLDLGALLPELRGQGARRRVVPFPDARRQDEDTRRQRRVSI